MKFFSGGRRGGAKPPFPCDSMFKTFLRCCLVLSFAFGGGVHAAGFQRLNLPMDMNGPALQGGIWYPCASPSRRRRTVR